MPYRLKPRHKVFVQVSLCPPALVSCPPTITHFTKNSSTVIYVCGLPLISVDFFFFNIFPCSVCRPQVPGHVLWMIARLSGSLATASCPSALVNFEESSHSDVIVQKFSSSGIIIFGTLGKAVVDFENG